MAAEKSLEAELLNDLLECPICLGIMESPNSLPCLHKFCYSCLRKWADEKENFLKSFPCPICKATTRKDSIKIDFNLKSIAESLTTKKSNDKKEQSKNIIKKGDLEKPTKQPIEDNEEINYCEKCLEIDLKLSQAEVNCAECSKHLCLDCCKIDSRFRNFCNDHMPISPIPRRRAYAPRANTQRANTPRGNVLQTVTVAKEDNASRPTREIKTWAYAPQECIQPVNEPQNSTGLSDDQLITFVMCFILITISLALLKTLY
ncbi:unnamed protein product [Owenia fusiformis]|uniref:Uncharacterized protein n=1 Tax=Owenia fusiformis TaxID=6347 RepID=A0A8J1XVE8_OWEFU|nr:unnamed protein product [Owenia fusiformis]